MQDYTYTTTSNVSGADAGSFLLMTLVFSVVIYLVYAFILSKVFAKAGRPAWAAYVPIYSSWVLFEIAGKPGWWVLLAFIPYLGGLILFVLYLLVSLELAKKFGKSSAFGVIGLWLFSFVGYIILAFDSSKYQGKSPAKTTTTA